MSQRAFAAALDADLHAGFLAAGMADQGTYTAPGGATVPCDVYVDRSVQEIGEQGQLRAARTEVTFVLGSLGAVAPVAHGSLTVDGDTFSLSYEISNDGSLGRWLVSRV